MKILPLNSAEATLETAGGKGMNLAFLTRAGFPVPPGFVVATGAYREFVSANRWLPAILAGATELTAADAGALERASARIRVAFSAGKMPEEIESAIRIASAQAGFQDKPVAVRSSATSEDLLDLSFAGQQDTYLNVVGIEQMLEAVVSCWSSLWTARAIGYRIRNGISHAEAAVAVIVQAMVQSEASGVLFTANPLTGLRREAVIDAALGLGEALVSGKVEPDHYVVDAFDNRILSKSLGAKKISTRPKAGGGVQAVEENLGQARQALSDETILRLANYGEQIQQAYGFPQDIEWALEDGTLHVLQSRPITSLFPVPRLSFDPLIVWFSFGAAQGIVGPMTPLGIDAAMHIAAGAGKMFGVTLKAEEADVFAAAGERLWIRISDVIRNPVGDRLLRGAMVFVEPGTGKILADLRSDPGLGAGTGKVRLITVWRMLGFGLPILARLARNMLRPEFARREFDALIESNLATAHIPAAADRFAQLTNVVTFMRARIGTAFRFLLPRFIPIFGPGIASLNLLTEMSGDRALALEVTRGLPQNVTTEMDLALWKTATAIRAEPDSRQAFEELEATRLTSRYQDGGLPPVAQVAIAGFLEKYGMRGVGEIDFGQPRWREDPTPLMHILQSYLKLDDAFAPDALFAKGEQTAQEAIDKLAVRARSQPGGWIKERIVRAAARRVRLLMGARESPKFFAVRTMGIARQALLEVGRHFVEAGTIERADDLVFLKLNELEALAASKPINWRELIAARRLAYRRELRRRQVPRLLVSDGRAFYEGLGSVTDTENTITGSPVSPGIAEGIVHVVLDPRGTQLAPGEILVCPGTDPAWTPLFMTAGGLITEVGGMMTHGSVVAREYGIPAVVGVHQATTRLKDGQRVRVDGTTGQIVVFESS